MAKIIVKEILNYDEETFKKHKIPSLIVDRLKTFVEIGAKGANLGLILDALVGPYGEPSPKREIDLLRGNPGGLQLCKDYPEAISRIQEQRKKYIKMERSINSAVKLLTNLSPIPEDNAWCIPVPDFNNKLNSMQKQLRETMNTYLKLSALPPGMEGHKMWVARVNSLKSLKLSNRRLKQNSRAFGMLINKSITAIVSELIRIGYSDNQAYKLTAKLIHSYYPHVHKDEDPAIIRQRYTYHMK